MHIECSVNFENLPAWRPFAIGAEAAAALYEM